MVNPLKPQSIIRLATLDDIPAIARVQVDTWRTTYAGIIPDDFLAALDYGQQERAWQSIVSDPSPKKLDFQ